MNVPDYKIFLTFIGSNMKHTKITKVKKPRKPI